MRRNESQNEGLDGVLNVVYEGYALAGCRLCQPLVLPWVTAQTSGQKKVL